MGAGASADMDRVTLVLRGLSVGAVQFMLDSGWLTPAELDRLVLPRKTLANRRKLDTLTPEQSDRLLRAARVIAAAEETFGAREKAATWLHRSTAALARTSRLRNCKSLTKNDKTQNPPVFTGYTANSSSSNALRWTGVGRVSTVSG